ncbi:MAG: sensor histidine kinase [Cytophagales bacterium]|nr:sensor histidine kinase [Cytophagales bacterium]
MANSIVKTINTINDLNVKIPYLIYDAPGCQKLTVEQIVTMDSCFVSPESGKIYFLQRNDQLIHRWLKFEIDNKYDKHVCLALTIFNYRNIMYYKLGEKWRSDTSGLMIMRKDLNSFLSYNIYQIPGILRGPQVYYLLVSSYHPDNETYIVGLLDLMSFYFSNFLSKGMEIGVICMTALFAIVLFLRLREIYYFFFFLFVLCYASFQAANYDFIYTFVNPLSITPTFTLNLYNIPYSLMTIFFMVFFQLLFNKYLHKYLTYAIYFMVFIRVVSLLFLKKYIDFMWTPTHELIYYTPIICIYVYLVFKRLKSIMIFIPSFVLLYMGVLIHTFDAIKVVIPYFYVNIHLDAILILLSIMSFTLTLAEQFKMIRDERETVNLQLIHQLKEIQDLKEEHNRHLELKVKERTEELEERNKQLDAFVYRASHDIKGPLKSVLGIINIAEMDNIVPAQKEYLLQIKNSVKRLDATIADLLAVARANYAQVYKTNIDFQKIINEVCQLFKNQIEAQHITIVTDIKPSKTFKSDEKIIYSVFQNLIENAIKYSDPNKKDKILRISIHHIHDTCKIQFQDNGLGIATEHLSKVFDMFYRASESGSGTGLGLYIVKLSIEKIGGKISISSQKGAGTTVDIEF